MMLCVPAQLPVRLYRASRRSSRATSLVDSVSDYPQASFSPECYKVLSSFNHMKRILLVSVAILCTFFLFRQILGGQKPSQSKQQIPLPSSKVLLEPVPGEVQRTNGFPGAMAISPNNRYIAILNNGWGTKESDYSQSIAILDTQSGQSSNLTLRDFPDAR